MEKSLFYIRTLRTGHFWFVAELVVHNLLESAGDEGALPHRPRGLALVPTRELAMQILDTLRKFPVQSMAASPGQSFVKETRWEGGMLLLRQHHATKNLPPRIASW